MKRPKLEEYWNNGLTNHERDYKDFIEDLEKYCDDVEEWLEYTTSTANTLLAENEDLDGNLAYYTLLSEANAEEVERLKKALKKACIELSMNEEAMTLDNSYHSWEEWKERFIKDE